MKGAPGQSAATHAREPQPPATRRSALLATVLPAVGLIAFWPGLRGQFVFDDHYWIVENPSIRSFSSLVERLPHDRRPLVLLSLGLNYRLGESDPFGYHLVNIVIHLLAGLTLFGVIRRTVLASPSLLLGDGSAPGRASSEDLRPIRVGPTGDRRSPEVAAASIAFAAALLWLVHPLQTQAVAYIVQRAESMMGLFMLLTLYCSIRGMTAEGRGPLASRAWFIAAIGACALGMWSKPVMVVAPPIIFLYDVVFISRSPVAALRRHWGLYLGLLASGILLASVFMQVVFPGPERASTVGFSVRSVTWRQYAATQPEVILHYLKLAFWPRWLCLDYQWPIATSAPKVLGAGAVIAFLLGASILGIRRRRWWGFAGAWFFVILAPTSSFIPIKDLAFEHRMYLSLAAVCSLSAAGLWLFVGRFVGTRFPRMDAARVVVGLGLLLALPLAWRTFERCRDYQDPIRLWRSVLTVSPNSSRAHINLAVRMQKAGRPEEAREHFEKGLRLDPESATAHNGLGLILRDRGETAQAVAEFQKAVSLMPNMADAHNNLATTLARLGRTDEALAFWARALQASPHDAEVHCNLAKTLTDIGRPDEAAKHCREALALKPLFIEARVNLVSALLADRKFAEAEEACRAALNLDDRRAELHNNLANAIMSQGRFDEAEAHFRKALELDPALVEAHSNWGNVLLRQHREKEAIVQYRAALKLRPDYATAWTNLGHALRQSKDMEGAMMAYAKVAEIKPSAAAFNDLGASLFYLRRDTEAQAAFESALRLDPRHGGAAGGLQAVQQRRAAAATQPAHQPGGRS